MSPEEADVVRSIVSTALAKGYRISVNDGEEWVLWRSQDEATILNCLGTTEEDWLRIIDETDKFRGTIFLLYGNSPEEVVSDCSANETIESILQDSGYNDL